MSAEHLGQLAVKQNGTFVGTRGRRIFWQSWSPAGDQRSRAAVVIAHGYAEHSGRYEFVAQRLTHAGYTAFALDHHGHGRSEGRRAQIVLADAVADLDQLVSVVTGDGVAVPAFLLGHSLGGAIALRYALAHQRRLTGMVLTGPLAAIDEPAALTPLVKVLARIAPGLPVTKLDTSLVSRDPAVLESYRTDPLVYHRPVPAVTAYEMLVHVKTLAEEAPAITLPTLLLYGGADGLCPVRGAEMLSARLGSTDLTTRSYEGLFHEILNEPERATVIRDIVRWLDAHTP